MIVGLLGPVWMCHRCPRFHPMGLVPRSTEYMSYVGRDGRFPEELNCLMKQM